MSHFLRPRFTGFAGLPAQDVVGVTQPIAAHPSELASGRASVLNLRLVVAHEVLASLAL